MLPLLLQNKLECVLFYRLVYDLHERFAPNYVPKKIRVVLKLPMNNDLAYFTKGSVSNVKSFLTLTPR